MLFLHGEVMVDLYFCAHVLHISQVFARHRFNFIMRKTMSLLFLKTWLRHYLLKIQGTYKKIIYHFLKVCTALVKKGEIIHMETAYHPFPFYNILGREWMTANAVELPQSQGLGGWIHCAREAEQGKTEGALGGLGDRALNPNPKLYLEF